MTSGTDIERRISGGESATLEFKKSTGQLNRAGETLCAFLNGDGGTVILGVTPEGRIVGQEVTDKTQREIAAMLERFEPLAVVEVEYVDLGKSGRKLIVLEARVWGEARPFTFDGRPYQRVETKTSRMPQERYEYLLLDRMHARQRWENQPAVGVRVEDLDAEEILRTREDAVRHRRISAATSMDVGDILDRLGLQDRRRPHAGGADALRHPLPRRLPAGEAEDGAVSRHEDHRGHPGQQAGVHECLRDGPRGDGVPRSNAAAVLALRRGADPARGPPDALREILLNAVMHRDYSDPGGAVGVAVFDDRIEVRSTGALPSGITAAMLSGPHESVLRNPLIVGAFNRTVAVEVWGRGTNRVIDAGAGASSGRASRW